MTAAGLELRGLRKAFGAIAVARDISLVFDPGLIHAVIGPNGAGKSSLIGQIAGEIRPDAGRIFLGGHEITGLSVVERARLGLARSFQVSELVWGFSALDNVALAVRGRLPAPLRFWGDARRETFPREAALGHLARVGLGEVASHPVEALSHGAHRQLELAMALAMDPRVLLLDEPMAGLAAGEAALMTRLLEGLSPRPTVVLVEHDMTAVFALADRISVLVDGRLVVTGDPATVRAHPEVRDAYLGTGCD